MRSRQFAIGKPALRPSSLSNYAPDARERPECEAEPGPGTRTKRKSPGGCPVGGKWCYLYRAIDRVPFG